MVEPQIHPCKTNWKIPALLPYRERVAYNDDINLNN